MKRIIISCLLFVLCIQSSYALENINLEVREIEDKVFFILSHQKGKVLQGTIAGANISIICKNGDVALTNVNPKLFEQYASDLKVSGNNISFKIKESLEKYKQVNGELFTAFKFTNKASTKDKTHDASSIKPQEVSGTNPNFIEVDYTKDSIKFSFKWKEKVGAAAFLRNGYLWIVFDRYKNFDLPKNSKIKLQDLSQKYISVLRFKVPGYQDLVVDLSRNTWTVKISKVDLQSKKIDIQKQEDGIYVPMNLPQPIIPSIIIQDPNLGDAISVVTSSIPLNATIDDRKFIEFTILNSGQGLAVALASDNVFLSAENSKGVKITTVKPTNPITANNENLALTSANSMLPFISQEILSHSFKYLKFKLMADIINSKSDLEKYNARLALAKFYFAHEMYEESLAIMRLIQADYLQILNTDYMSNMLLAVLLTYNNYNTEADTIFSALLELYRTYGQSNKEIEMWANYNSYMLGKNNSMIGFIDCLETLKLYNEELYWNLAFDELELALKNKNFDLCDALFKNLRGPSLKRYNNELNFAKARYYHKKGDESIALQFLNDILSQKDVDLFAHSVATVLKIKIEKQLNKISAYEAIRILEDIKFDWRGSAVEEDILSKLAEYYKEVDDPVNALRSYYYLSNIVDKNSLYFNISSEIARLYSYVFDEKLYLNKLSDFDAVSLFYEFHDLLPVGREGDIVILNISKRLINLDLLDTASELLDHQIKYRLENEEKVVTADHLALVYILNDQPEKAIEVLNKTDRDNEDYNVYLSRLRLKAQAFANMKKYGEAIKMIKDDNSEDGITLRKNLYFKNNNWQDYISLMQNRLIAKLGSRDINTVDAQDILRLAICYSMLNKDTELAELNTMLKSTDNQSLKQVVNVLNSTAQPLENEHIKEILKQDQIQQFTENYKKLLFN